MAALALAQPEAIGEHTGDGVDLIEQQTASVTGGDAFVQLDDVLMGRADVALQDSPTVVQYVKAHPDKVKVLWLEHPPSVVPGGFAVRSEDEDLRQFLNSCLLILRTDGTIEKLDKKWRTYGYFEARQLVPADGLSDFLAAERKKK